ncbi:FadR/GntR family transcriptional regulator [Leucobacter soli]|uniref:FadR/GntR family transcriptional regulator n=1 Tax=Leucobacter soli TaxID=2812850 RepID=UPI0036071CC0
MSTKTGSERARNTLAYLRRHITTGTWPVGTRIPIEPELAEQIGVGRSTVREAVRSLASIGMLETLPGRGTFVRSAAPTSTLLNEFLNDFTLEEILSYRRALEIEAAQQAALHRSEDDLVALEQAAVEEQGCTRCPVLMNGSESSAFDSRFHRLLFDAAKNRLLASLYAGTNDQLRTPPTAAGSRTSRRPAKWSATTPACSTRSGAATSSTPCTPWPITWTTTW